MAQRAGERAAGAPLGQAALRCVVQGRVWRWLDGPGAGQPSVPTNPSLQPAPACIPRLSQRATLTGGHRHPAHDCKGPPDPAPTRAVPLASGALL